MIINNDGFACPLFLAKSGLRLASLFGTRVGCRSAAETLAPLEVLQSQFKAIQGYANEVFDPKYFSCMKFVCNTTGVLVGMVEAGGMV